MNFYEAGYKVGSKVKRWNPYGDFYFMDYVTRITPKGRYAYVGEERFRINNKGEGYVINRWGYNSIKLIKEN